MHVHAYCACFKVSIVRVCSGISVVASTLTLLSVFYDDSDDSFSKA